MEILVTVGEHVKFYNYNDENRKISVEKKYCQTCAGSQTSLHYLQFVFFLSK